MFLYLLREVVQSDRASWHSTDGDFAVRQLQIFACHLKNVSCCQECLFACRFGCQQNDRGSHLGDAAAVCADAVDRQVGVVHLYLYALDWYTENTSSYLCKDGEVALPIMCDSALHEE